VPAQSLVIVGPNLPQEALATFHVHVEGCRDLKRGWLGDAVRRSHDASIQPIKFESRLQVESFVYDFAPRENEDYILGDWQDEFHFAPCVTLPLSTEDHDGR
jgi:hypothetical protein